ncbi:MAG: xanthine dehydrogenase family protein subunit M [Bacteroidota bacterium]
MIPSNFIYKKVNTIDEALSILKSNDDAKLLAGGHSLIPALKLRLSGYDTLVDVSKLEELRKIEEKDGRIVIGAMVTHGQIVDSDLIKEKLSFFSEGADLIGDVQVRNMGTLGGSIAHADPAADWPAMLLAADATVHVQSADGSREVAAEDFFQGLFHTALEDHEMITAVSMPIVPGARSTYVKFMQPASRFAIVGCAAVVAGNGTAQNVRIAFSGVSATPFRDSAVEGALEGKALDASVVSEAAGQAAEGVSVMSDHYASESYRKQMAKVFCGRALAKLV